MKAGAESVPGKLGQQELTRLVEAGEIETVLAVFPDFYGRLLGKRFVGRFFVESVAAHGLHACNYLLACDMEMDPVPGYDFASWERATATSAASPTGRRCAARPGSRRRQSCSATSSASPAAAGRGRAAPRSSRARSSARGRWGSSRGRARSWRCTSSARRTTRRAGKLPGSRDVRQLHRGLPHPAGDEGGAARRGDRPRASTRAACRWRAPRGSGARASRS